MCRGTRIREIVRRLKILYKNETPLDIIHHRNIVLCYIDENCISNGAYLKNENTQFIFINTKLCDYEARMTYAHELGHSILHPNVDTFELKKTDPLLLTKYEKEAQIFAAEFLLDDDILERYHGQSIFNVAREEYVSLELVKLKLINLYKSNNLHEFNNLEESNFDEYYAI
ncbi:ImmA/IrrE family metallo-endopeptidase [Romboutsia hominis]|uniref:ImmA/IrrE family metallo-endopeptidase n=1 Tax=Romboutsia faecis TaxID=2764597 RepID=A0ABR7JNJ3_9FIRM|nr:ImmA/IrrE family metallo-endopeptidase [Romboutsia faecis]MBC5996506.1 ImmA/IrrE family metallo-endopeptidase [Romboutsia faecis]